MHERLDNEPGERGRRRLTTRSVIALACIIAIAGAIGLVISFGQRPAAQITHPAPTPSSLQPITPSPVPGQPQAGQGFSIADDVATHEIVLFGGVGDYPNTWLWDGSKWTLAHPPASPEGRFGASEAYDPRTKTVLLFGGRLEPGTPVNDTWAWNGTTWGELDAGVGGPQPGEGSDMAWDPAQLQMVLLTRSGVISEPAETWIWSGTRWTRSAAGPLPAGATFSPMWFDPVSRSLLAVGCCVGPPPSTGAANTTWRWNGASWTLLPSSGAAPSGGSTMALDPPIGHLVLCACGAPASSNPPLWGWDGAGWVSLRSGPVPVMTGTAITDSDRGELLLFGTPASALQAGHTPVEVWQLTPRLTWLQLGRVG
jgi:hypothetical protein